MHISEGVLSPAILGAGYVLTTAATYVSLRRADYAHLATTAVLASVFFVASLIRVPLGPGNIHLVLNGLLGLYLGWAIFPALLVALLLQAVFFQYGGIAVLGINTFDMAFPALLCHYAFRFTLDKANGLRLFSAFCCGAFSVAGAALCTALALGLSDEGFLASAKLLLLAHIPVIFLEGLITALTVAFVAKNRPELLSFSGK